MSVEAGSESTAHTCPRCGKDLRNGGDLGHWRATGPMLWCEPEEKHKTSTFPAYKNQATLDALIEEDRKQMMIVNEAIEKYKPRTMECPWCHGQIPENDIHTHTVKHNQEACKPKPKCDGCEHCPCTMGQHYSCLACEVSKPIVAHGEYEIEKSQPFPEGYVKFDILGWTE